MTCIIALFTPDKIAISKDRAVSSDNRTYTGVEKTILLSNDPPMTMSFYGNSDFDEIPLENIISEYVKNTDFKKIDKVKKDFPNHVNEIMPKHELLRMNETLINLTRLKRIIESKRITVDSF